MVQGHGRSLHWSLIYTHQCLEDRLPWKFRAVGLNVRPRDNATRSQHDSASGLLCMCAVGDRDCLIEDDRHYTHKWPHWAR